MNTLYQKFLLITLLLLSCNALASLSAKKLAPLNMELDQPSDMAVNKNGDVYALDGLNHRVVVFTSSGELAFIFGDHSNLNHPMGISIANEQVYIADSKNHQITLFSQKGTFIRSIPLDGEKPPEPVSLTVNRNIISWSDRANHQVCRTEIDTGKTIQCWGQRGEAKGQFQFPFQLKFDSDNYIHVVDVLNGRVQSFNHKGRPFSQTARFGLKPGQLYRPNGLAFYTNTTTSEEYMLISDSYRGTISVFHKGRAAGLLSDSNGSVIKFLTPVGLTVYKNKLYVAAARSNHIEVLTLQLNNPTTLGLTSPTQSAPEEGCVSCHLSWSSDYSDNEGEQDGVPPVATEQMCYSCHHGAVLDSRHAIGRANQHPDIHHRPSESKTVTQENFPDEIPESFPLIHSKNKLRGNTGQLSCGSCHTPHTSNISQTETLYTQHQNPWLRALNHGGDLCEACHESRRDNVQENPPSGINHPIGIYLKPPADDQTSHYASTQALQEGLPKSLIEQGGALGHNQALICQSCHQIHGANNKALTVLDAKKGRLCSECHPRQHAENKKEARKKGIHPVNMKLDEIVTINGKETQTLTCLTCHSVHSGEPGTPVLNVDNSEGQLCSACHKKYERVVNTDHDMRVTAKETENRFGHSSKKTGACGACHTMHRGEPDIPFLYAGDFQAYDGEEPALPRDQICLDCHTKMGRAEKLVVKHFSHPEKDMILRSNPNAMPLINAKNEIDEFGAIACVTCHNPHQWAPDEITEQNDSHPASTSKKIKNQDGNVLNSFLRNNGSKGSFCINCHGLETQVKYKYFHDQLARDKGIDYLK